MQMVDKRRKIMKKTLSILLVLFLLMVQVLSLAEGAEAAPEYTFKGDWYGDLQGVVLKLTLHEDGTYAASITSQPDDVKTGTWVYDDGFIRLEGDGAPDINVLSSDVLKWTGLEVFLSREAPQVYAPAGPLADAAAELYAGYWKAAYVDMMGTPVLASAFEDETDLYVEGTHAILGGPVLGDTIVALTFADGAFTGDNEGAAVQLQLQQDGFLRMTVAGTDTAPQTWYLLRAYSPILDGENPAEAAAEP